MYARKSDCVSGFVQQLIERPEWSAAGLPNAADAKYQLLSSIGAIFEDDDTIAECGLAAG